MTSPLYYVIIIVFGGVISTACSPDLSGFNAITVSCMLQRDDILPKLLHLSPFYLFNPGKQAQSPPA